MFEQPVTRLEALRLLGVSERTLERLAADGLLSKRIDPVTGRTLYCAEQVGQLVEQRNRVRLEDTRPSRDRARIYALHELKRRHPAEYARLYELAKKRASPGDTGDARTTSADHVKGKA